ncbi:GntR family transcriptional regulator [Chloroflexi bacterium TSY]|nr:GntR family transcriptional regulator [Chloroflexi bacterium TSY]
MPAPKTFRSKKEFVYETLREQILHGSLEPEARLIIDELSTEMNVSPIPVREALQQLHADGFVTIEPYVGARVAGIHPDLIQEVFALLEAIEVVSARAACERMTEADLAEMETLLQRMDQNVSQPELWSQDNVRLHKLICERAEVHLVGNVLTWVVDHWDRLRRYYLDSVFSDRIQTAHQDHWRLFDALRTRDPEVVEHVIRTHNQSALAAYMRHLEQNGQT